MLTQSSLRQPTMAVIGLGLALLGLLAVACASSTGVNEVTGPTPTPFFIKDNSGGVFTNVLEKAQAEKPFRIVIPRSGLEGLPARPIFIGFQDNTASGKPESSIFVEYSRGKASQKTLCVSEQDFPEDPSVLGFTHSGNAQKIDVAGAQVTLVESRATRTLVSSVVDGRLIDVEVSFDPPAPGVQAYWKLGRMEFLVRAIGLERQQVLSVIESLVRQTGTP